MKKLLYVLLPVLVLATIGCRPQSLPPTPFIPPSPTAAAINQPLAIPITDLAASPAFFAGTILQLTGQYRRLPKLVCQTDPHPAPVSWGLLADGLLAQASGFDTQLRELAPENLTLTVEGRWERWQGPVGCGKRATQQELWYLTVTKILVPSPLTQVTLTPSSSELEEATAVASLILTPTIPSNTGDISIPTATFPAAEEPPPEAETPPADEEPVDEEPPTETPETAVAFPTATPTSAASPTPSPTPTLPAEGTAPTPTPLADTIIYPGSISEGDLGIEHLQANEIHDWSFFAEAGVTITVSVASVDADLSLTLLSPSNSSLLERNSTATVGVETIAGFSIGEDGDYHIQVHTTPDIVTDYAIMIASSDSDYFVLRGIIGSGDSFNDSLGSDTHHFWHFYGQEGNMVTIDLTPLTANSDPVLELYGPDASSIGSLIDEGSEGDLESLVDFSLPTTGLYSIRVGELDFLPMTYELFIDLQ